MLQSNYIARIRKSFDRKLIWSSSTSYPWNIVLLITKCLIYSFPSTARKFSCKLNYCIFWQKLFCAALMIKEFCSIRHHLMAFKPLGQLYYFYFILYLGIGGSFNKLFSGGVKFEGPLTIGDQQKRKLCFSNLLD